MVLPLEYMDSDSENSHFAADVEAAYDATIEVLTAAIDLRDHETQGHSQRVAEMTVRLARLFGFKDEELRHIRRGALLHDIGKLGVPDSILLKPSSLTESEWIEMRRHPTLAYEWLRKIPYLRPALDIPYCHHEHWNGGGYPRGLMGEEIPLAARIFSVVDVYDALTYDRPYRAALQSSYAIEIIETLSGTQLDPQVVTAFSEQMRFTPLRLFNPSADTPYDE